MMHRLLEMSGISESCLHQEVNTLFTVDEIGKSLPVDE